MARAAKFGIIELAPATDTFRVCPYAKARVSPAAPPGPRRRVVRGRRHLGGGLAAQQAPAAQPAPAPASPIARCPPLTFRVEVNYVEVDAVVIDQQGRFVGNLQPGDFQVLEDGKPQTIVNFGLVEIPLERPDAPLFADQPIEPDVQSNVQAVRRARLPDRPRRTAHRAQLHAAGCGPPRKQFIQHRSARTTWRRWSRRGATRDAGVHGQQAAAARPRSTGSWAAALRSATLEQDRRSTTASAAARPGVDTAPGTSTSMQRAYNATTDAAVDRQLSEFMSGVRGRRKALVLFSEGIDYDILDVFNNPDDLARSSRTPRGRPSRAATRANVSVYTRRSARPGRRSRATRWRLTPAWPIGADPASGSAASGCRTRLRLQHDSLRVLAEETGGFAVAQLQRFRHRVRPDPARTTAATTCSATTRRTTAATAGSGRSRCR